MIDDINALEKNVGYSRHRAASILDAIFAEIGTTNRVFVEFGAGATGRECNTGKLRHDGWTGLWMDGEGDDVLVKKEYVTAENINALLDKHAIPPEFDALSIDIDGVDWWVWRAMFRQARVVVVEYNAICGPERGETVPYDPHFKWERDSHFGASLMAWVQLAARKGYTLVGTCSFGVDAFFVRNDLVEGHFKVRPPAELYHPPRYGRQLPNGTFEGHPPSQTRKMQEALPDYSLDELAADLSTDKGLRHGFLAFYDTQFGPLRHSAKVFIEIGIGEVAGSIHLWPRYFPNAMVYGVDAVKLPWPGNPRTQYFQFHQTDAEAWETAFKDIIKAKADIIVDDASHRMADQQRTLELLLPHVRKGGLYVIEDLQTSVSGLFPGYGADKGDTTLDLLDDWLKMGEFKTPHMLQPGIVAGMIANIAIFGRRSSLTAVILRY